MHNNIYKKINTTYISTVLVHYFSKNCRIAVPYGIQKWYIQNDILWKDFDEIYQLDINIITLLELMYIKEFW
jgi:hypothetical protein